MSPVRQVQPKTEIADAFVPANLRQKPKGNTQRLRTLAPPERVSALSSFSSFEKRDLNRTRENKRESSAHFCHLVGLFAKPLDQFANLKRKVRRIRRIWRAHRRHCLHFERKRRLLHVASRIANRDTADAANPIERNPARPLVGPAAPYLSRQLSFRPAQRALGARRSQMEVVRSAC